MAQGLESEVHTSEGDKIDKSHQQDLFGSDEQDEEVEDTKVDLEAKLISTLEDLSRVIN